jgi:hypothetical protein
VITAGNDVSKVPPEFFRYEPFKPGRNGELGNWDSVAGLVRFSTFEYCLRIIARHRRWRRCFDLCQSDP